MNKVFARIVFLDYVSYIVQGFGVYKCHKALDKVFHIGVRKVLTWILNISFNNVLDQILDGDRVLNNTLGEVSNRISNKWTGTGYWTMH